MFIVTEYAALNKSVSQPKHMLLILKRTVTIRNIEKDRYLAPAHILKTTRLSHSDQYCRYQTCIDTLKNSFFPRTIPSGIVSPPPKDHRGVKDTPYLVENTAERFFFSKFSKSCIQKRLNTAVTHNHHIHFNQFKSILIVDKVHV